MDSSKFRIQDLPSREEASTFLSIFCSDAEDVDDLKWRAEGGEFVGSRKYLVDRLIERVLGEERFPTLDCRYIDHLLREVYAEKSERREERE